MEPTALERLRAEGRVSAPLREKAPAAAPASASVSDLIADQRR